MSHTVMQHQPKLDCRSKERNMNRILQIVMCFLNSTLQKDQENKQKMNRHTRKQQTNNSIWRSRLQNQYD